MKKLLIICAATASLGTALTPSQASAGGFFHAGHGHGWGYGHGYGYGYRHDFDRSDYDRYHFRGDFRRGR